MGHRYDVVMSVLRDSYKRGLNWESRSGPFKGASPFWIGLRQIFSHVCEFFIAKLGDSSEFYFILFFDEKGEGHPDMVPPRCH